jgi:hypothetical protein
MERVGYQRKGRMRATITGVSRKASDTIQGRRTQGVACTLFHHHKHEKEYRATFLICALICCNICPTTSGCSGSYFAD